MNKNPRARIEGESEKAYQAFIKYLDMGDKRSIRNIVNTKSDLNKFLQWSSKYNWVQRVKDVSDNDEDIKQKAHEKAIDKMAKEHAILGEKLRLKASEGLEYIEPHTITPRDIAQLSKAGVDIERQARGVSDKIEMDIKGNLGVSIQLIETSVEEIKNDKLNAKQDAEN